MKTKEDSIKDAKEYFKNKDLTKIEGFDLLKPFVDQRFNFFWEQLKRLSKLPPKIENLEEELRKIFYIIVKERLIWDRELKDCVQTILSILRNLEKGIIQSPNRSESEDEIALIVFALDRIFALPLLILIFLEGDMKESKISLLTRGELKQKLFFLAYFKYYKKRKGKTKFQYTQELALEDANRELNYFRGKNAEIYTRKLYQDFRNWLKKHRWEDEDFEKWGEKYL